MLQSLHNYLGEMVNKIDAVDNDETLTCKQKMNQLNRLNSDFEKKSIDKLDEIKTLAEEIASLVDDFDEKQLYDQIKLLERRQKDVAKRFERKLNTLNQAVLNQDIVLQEVQEMQNWIREKSAVLDDPPLLGFETHATEKQLQNLKVGRAVTFFSIS